MFVLGLSSVGMGDFLLVETQVFSFLPTSIHHGTQTKDKRLLPLMHM
jgi:hypothetical protein